MTIEADRLSAAHAVILSDGFTGRHARRAVSRRPRHQGRRRHVRISRPPAPPPKACAGSSSTRPISTRCRPNLIAHHINAIQAIVRERTKLDTAAIAGELSKQLRGIADEFLTHANRDRPEHLEAILAPSIVPAE